MLSEGMSRGCTIKVRTNSAITTVCISDAMACGKVGKCARNCAKWPARSGPF